MKTFFKTLLFALILSVGTDWAAAQGTAFTYQGQLLTNGVPVTGVYDFTFELWTLSSGGSLVGAAQTDAGQGVTNGLFTTTVDFGAQYNGTTYWLQIGVRSNGVGSYLPLSSRQELTPAPYAITAENVHGSVPASQLTGTLPSGVLTGTYGDALTLSNAGNSFTGNGAGLSGVNASSLNGLGTNSFWQTTGNLGTTAGANFLGTRDVQPLEIHVDGVRALRIEPGTNSFGPPVPNIIGGSPGNFVAPNSVGNVIAGGGDYSAGVTNFITGGNFNVISGGAVNVITNGYENVIGGGFGNIIGANGSATIPGGYSNVANGFSSFAAGYSAQALDDQTFVWSDGSSTAPFASTGTNQFLIQATGGVGIDTASPQQALSVNGGLNIDQAGDNSGSLNQNGTNGYGLTFGSSSGEGIASERQAGSPNQYGLDFYTDFTNRMAIRQSGLVGINTTNPAAQLDVEAPSSTSIAVQGITASTAADAYGVLGIVSSTLPGGFSAGVRGENNGTVVNGIGVWGSQNGGGWGGYFTSVSGDGVNASSISGTAVNATTTSGTAIKATSISGSALTIAGGAIHITGASTNSTTTAAFIQVAANPNLAEGGTCTLINNSLCNGDPNAILIVTPNASPMGNTNAYGFWDDLTAVYYGLGNPNLSSTNWYICSQDATLIPPGVAWNVLVIKN